MSLGRESIQLQLPVSTIASGRNGCSDQRPELCRHPQLPKSQVRLSAMSYTWAALFRCLNPYERNFACVPQHSNFGLVHVSLSASAQIWMTLRRCLLLLTVDQKCCALEVTRQGNLLIQDENPACPYKMFTNLTMYALAGGQSTEPESCRPSALHSGSRQESCEGKLTPGFTYQLQCLDLWGSIEGHHLTMRYWARLQWLRQSYPLCTLLHSSIVP